MLKVTKAVYDSYEAAYYMIQGATLENVYLFKIAENKQKKNGFRTGWKMILTGIPKEDIEKWHNDLAYALVKDVKRERKRIKKFIKNNLYDR